MKLPSWVLTLVFALVASFACSAFAQDDLDSEFEDSEVTAPEEERPPEMNPVLDAPTTTKTDSSALISPNSFRKPVAPKGGGVLEVPHPNAAKGLLRIEKDGTYIYRTTVPEKSKSSSLRMGFLTTPLIKNDQGISFGDIYGTDGLVGVLGEYEWQPFRKFGALGIRLGSGLVVARGNGRFADGSLAEEIYNLAVVPLSAELSYRFEYVRRQWAVPYVLGGAVGYGLAELRDDGKKPVLAFAPAVSVGGGVHINISRWDIRGAFILAQEYQIADLWLTVEGKVIQGLDQELDMSNQSLSAGFTVDF